jgi:2-polyprenyl-3-methyl-5-hydroxy-6-metoxy-1,4-benzoquinol methylase
MLSKIKKLYRAIIDLLLMPYTVHKINNNINNIVTLLSNTILNPIDRHVLLSSVYGRSGLYDSFFEGWKIRRIDKILELYGIDYFKNKSVLELGCGHGDIGAFFAELGANVLCLDGRAQSVNFANLKHRKVNNFKCLQCNLENDFTEFGKFDLIINFGLLYHLKNVTEHLNYCFKMSDDIMLETAVCDSADPYKIFFFDEEKDIDVNALEGIGSRPSPFFIERIAQENNFEGIRYFSADLNYDNFFYDWEHKNDDPGSKNITLRRCWRFKKIITSL